MANEIIDGRIVGAKLKQTAKRQSIFETIVFQLPDGTLKTLHKLAAAPAVADALTPGTSGRFYLHSVLGHNALHGIRSYDGRAIVGVAKASENSLLTLSLFNLAVVAAFLMLDGQLKTFPAIFMVVAFAVTFAFRQARIAAQRQFDDDAGIAVHDGLVPAFAA